MKFARLGTPGAEIPVLLEGDRYLDLRPVTSDVNGDFLAGDFVARVAAARDAGELPELPDAATMRIGAPIARPSAVICIGMNYAAHAAESGSEPPTIPIIFLKTPNTVVGPNDAVTIPRGSEKTDWEVELGTVIGTRTAYLDSPEESMAHVAGFVAANDVSERDFQMAVSGGQWSKGKIAFGFNPTGPWLVTPDEVDHQALGLRSFVNGEPRQDSNTSDMIFTVEQIVHHLSQYVTLEPGDLILTGTPQGVALSGKYPYLAAGDVVEIEIDGLGRQRQDFVAWEAEK
ncbi:MULTISPECIES: fumarylacetoacetate hydrolase family protein [unclassified Microbacterium]|uniref:fumarylacetoacetate hydrolase family protein n=1 Tax=unclassified Microbacterium TaxID=2609290 RepID=UPI002468D4DF|nr:MULTISPECIES: fumarylacetoacetate hydrolase family protein [unclassified Microbacterium]MDH5132431.1 fumarylacetoacetate hydrolase family protein [Microbacterium sp. RD10]MDH5137053.1 fumarylacetoacetate hydrolase family protein [Microbacterium sp. RD11]MDH5144906.1 fumarylacetoacetate hydrolase family protein [Microbacterium sp. RD12]MDH5154359.1 fumarylacetoacetate hydrolase family protein [Microbacterium sp. RD06]MDH5167856.1 fumarylacetoacetate hydrolase family protein [Microbacterium s